MSASPLLPSAWLASYEHTVVDKINQRIEDITGLDVKTAEELQVTSARGSLPGGSLPGG